MNEQPKTSFAIKKDASITFNNTDGVVAKFDFNGPELVFTGNADESAKIFINFVAKYFSERLEQERQAEREACAKVCDEQGQGPFALEHYAALTYAGATHDCAAAIRARGEK